MSGPTARLTGLALAPQVTAALEAVLPRMAEHTVAAVTPRCPPTPMPSAGGWGQNVENAVRAALGAFLRLATRSEESDPAPPLSAALDAAYDLGRGGGTRRALHRRVVVGLSSRREAAWRELSETGVAAGLAAGAIAEFAELVFAFIDELSASSVSGHAG